MSVNKLLPVLVLLLVSLLPLPALAGQGMSLEQAVSKVKKETGGRILSAETRTRDGQRQHRIKVLLPDGRIRVINVKAKR